MELSTTSAGYIETNFLRKNTFFFFQINFQALYNLMMIMANRTKIKSLKRNKMTNK